MSEPGVHRIRLKGPWDVSAPNSKNDDFERHHLPGDWRKLFGNLSGTATFRRSFHRPSNLDVKDRVLIHIPQGTGDLTDFSVNSKPLEPISLDPLKFDVTSELIDFNQIQFSLSFEPEQFPEVPGGLWETVFVEIVDGNIPKAPDLLS